MATIVYSRVAFMFGEMMTVVHSDGAWLGQIGGSLPRTYVSVRSWGNGALLV